MVVRRSCGKRWGLCSMRTRSERSSARCGSCICPTAGEAGPGRRRVPAVLECTGQCRRFSGARCKDIANVVGGTSSGVVVDSFAQNLSVIAGYRTAASADNDPGWALWQANRMDARQAGCMCRHC